MIRLLNITLVLIILSTSTAFAEKVIGVTAFKNLSKQKKLSWLQEGIADSISYKFRNVKEYIVIDRTNVDKVINEIRLGQSGLIDDKTAKKAGKALNADILVVGNYQVYGKQIRITAKMVDVESHKVLKQVQSTGVMDNIFQLQDEIALNIIQQSDIKITTDLKDKLTKKYTENISAYKYFSQGQQLYYQANYEKAINKFNKAISIDRNYSLAYAGLGKAYASLYWKIKNYSNKKKPKLLEKSFKFSKKALSKNKNLEEAHLSLAKYYQNVEKSKVPNKWKLCEEETNKAIKINPNSAEGYFLLSRIYAYNDEKEEMYLKKSLGINNFLADAHNNLGIIYTAQKKYLLAEESFKNAIKIDPNYKTAYMNIGVVYDRQKRYKDAVEMYKIVVKKYPDYPLGLVNLGIGYRRLKKYDKAIVYFKKAVKVKPDYAFGIAEVAYYYLVKKKYKKSISYYKKALKIEPRNRYSLANIGYCYQQKKNYSQAIYYLKKSANYHKDYAWPAGQLGYIYRWNLKDKTKALEWYNKAATRDPKNQDYKKNVKELLSDKG